jgi:vancomycin permeability regulator SanA
MGIDAVGFVAADNSSPQDIAGYAMREKASTLGALVDLAIDRKPKFTGPPEADILTNTNPDR